ncbi:MAG: Arm DNA-binding domain-containing protein [Alphaproteobacteria bacterium]|nr:Arm DNA-binding domain-containing protein [Alphaproteobacteria bacterium]
MPLTNTQCQNAKPKDKPYKLADAAGMYLEIMPSGSKYWRWKYRWLGKESRLALGV